MPIANLKEIRKGNPIPASWLERVRRSILGSIIGAGGTRVTWRGNKLVIESGDYRARTDGRASRLVQFVGVNDSGVEIPARSFAEITAYNADGTLSLDKPSEDSLPAARLAIVGAAPIPATDDAGEKGRAVVHPATVGSQEVAYSGTAPVAGDEFGSVANQWYGSTSKTGFKATGADSASGVALVSPFSASKSFSFLYSSTSSYSHDPIEDGWTYESWVNVDSQLIIQPNKILYVKLLSNIIYVYKAVIQVVLQLKTSDDSILSFSGDIGRLVYPTGVSTASARFYQTGGAIILQSSSSSYYGKTVTDFRFAFYTTGASVDATASIFTQNIQYIQI